MIELTYKEMGEVLVPDLKMEETKPLGRYGRMRQEWLRENKPLMNSAMMISGKLYPHLLEIEETANERMEELMPKLAKEAGATESLKAEDPMRWVGLMNNCKAQAEEIIRAELIAS